MNTKHQKQISSQNGRHIFTHLTPLREHIRPYCELARLEKPVGTWLIFFPALMGLTFAEIEFQNQRIWGPKSIKIYEVELKIY